MKGSVRALALIGFAGTVLMTTTSFAQAGVEIGGQKVVTAHAHGEEHDNAWNSPASRWRQAAAWS